jgi:peptidoglycan/LPS O-acetylase OafA/YrhL
MNNRTLSAMTLGSFLISLGIGIILYVATDYGLMIILWTTLLIFGIALLALSFMYSAESGKFGPSESSYRMVAGTLTAVVGFIGMLNTFADVSIWILAAIFIIALALVIMIVALINGKKEGR